MPASRLGTDGSKPCDPTQAGAHCASTENARHFATRRERLETRVGNGGRGSFANFAAWFSTSAAAPAAVAKIAR
jgi:hypothetical protein